MEKDIGEGKYLGGAPLNYSSKDIRQSCMENQPTLYTFAKKTRLLSPDNAHSYSNMSYSTHQT